MYLYVKNGNQLRAVSEGINRQLPMSSKLIITGLYQIPQSLQRKMWLTDTVLYLPIRRRENASFDSGAKNRLCYCVTMPLCLLANLQLNNNTLVPVHDYSTIHVERARHVLTMHVFVTISVEKSWKKPAPKHTGCGCLYPIIISWAVSFKCKHTYLIF